MQTPGTRRQAPSTSALRSPASICPGGSMQPTYLHKNDVLTLMVSPRKPRSDSRPGSDCCALARYGDGASC